MYGVSAAGMYRSPRADHQRSCCGLFRGVEQDARSLGAHSILIGYLPKSDTERCPACRLTYIREAFLVLYGIP